MTIKQGIVMYDERIELKKGDITQLNIKSIVNAANSSLMGGGGVDGAIHRAAGPKLHEECMRIIAKIGECTTGEAVITSAGNIPNIKYVIHTVGPVWRGGDKGEEKLLEDCYRNSLELACDFEIEETAFPNISTGIYGYPKKEAAQTAINTVSNFLKDNVFIKKVVFVCFDDENYRIYKNILEE